MSDLNTAFEVWTTLKEQVKDVNESSAEVVTCLIDTLGYSGADIKASEFNSDPDIKDALQAFDLAQEEEEEDDGLDPWGDKYEDEDNYNDEDDDY